MSRTLPRRFRPDAAPAVCGLAPALAAGAGAGGESIRLRTAKAYDKYQNCGLRGAQSLFATGW